MKPRQLFMTGLVTACLTGAVNATIMTFDLTSDHCSGNCLGGTAGTSAGTVTVNDSGGVLSFDITMNTGFDIVNTGFPLSFAFNLNGNPTVTYSGLTAGFQIPDVIGTNQQAAGSYSQDGTGTFEYGVLWMTQGGGHGTHGPLDFTISAATSLALASLQQNSNGQFFTTDVISPNGNTGNVDASVGTSTSSNSGGPSGSGTVPEPSSTALALLGVALLGITFLRRRQSMR